MKVKFDLKYRQQIESDEYKVETADGRQVRIVCWDAHNPYRENDIVALATSSSGEGENILRYYSNGHLISDSANIGNKDLIVVIPDEDERIRKALVQYLIDYPSLLPRGLYSRDDFFTYLEKQKENTEKEYVFRPSPGTCITIAAEQAIRRANEGDRLVLAFNEVYVPVNKHDSVKRIVDEYYSFIEKRKEQEPTEWSEEEKARIDRIVDVLDWAEDKGRISYSDWEEYVCYVKSLKPQLKQGWSEEDEKMLASFLHKVEVCDLLTNKENVWIVKRLKSLRPQQKQEWSDGDEKKLSAVISLMKSSRAVDPFYDKMYLESWLKSLPLNLKKKNEDVAKLCSNEWSEEDEETLQLLISYFGAPHLIPMKINTSDKVVDFKDIASWLKNRFKSFRPQPHTVSIKNATKFGNLEYERGVKDGIQSEKSRQWKPSEEQMGTLKRWIQDHELDGDTRDIYPVFYSLLTDLQNL